MKRWERAAPTMKLQEATGLTGHGPGSQRPGKLEAAPEVVAFIESLEGLALWHRWSVAPHVVITLLGSGGIRRVGVFLELTELYRFVAASYGAQPRLSGQIETATFHNHFIRRPDGTTPAERFFGDKPADLFEWLLNQVPMPGRPTQERLPPSVAKPLLRAVA